MCYDGKIVFHIPMFTVAYPDRVAAVCYLGFREELISRCRLYGQVFISTVRKPLLDVMVDEELLTVCYEGGMDAELRQIFLELVCKYDAELLQDEYCYEYGDVLVSVVVGDSMKV